MLGIALQPVNKMAAMHGRHETYSASGKAISDYSLNTFSTKQNQLQKQRVFIPDMVL